MEREIIINTSNPDEMFGLYLAENLDRKWNEDFADDDTGEITSIIRTERIAEKGDQVNNDLLTQIRFLIESGDIKSVKCSNQKRKGKLILSDSKMVWEVTITDLDGSSKIICNANGLSDAITVSNEFVETKLEGVYTVTQLKEMGAIHIVPFLGKKPAKGKYYRIEAMFSTDAGFLEVLTFITLANNADEAMIPIKNYVQTSIIEEEFDCNIVTAKTIGCKYLLCE